MKKLTQLSLILVLSALPFNLNADQSSMFQRQMGSGDLIMGHSFYEFCDKCGTYHNRGHMDDAKPTSEKEARDKFESYLKVHLKGFSITKIEKTEMPRGAMYWAEIKDKNGNEMELHMNPWGYIRGPFIK